MRPALRGRVTTLPAADIVENLKYFSLIPLSRSTPSLAPPVPQPVLSRVAPPPPLPPPPPPPRAHRSPVDYQINKGEYQIKLRSRSVRDAALRFDGTTRQV